MLVVVNFRLFDGLVFVIEAKKRGNPKAKEHTQQEKSYNGCDAGHQPVGYHGKPLPYILLRAVIQGADPKAKGPPERASKKRVTENWQLLLLVSRRGFSGLRCNRSDPLGRLFHDLRQRSFQRNLEDLVHRIHEMQFHFGSQILGYFSEVFFVVLGQDHFEQPRPVRRQEFLL
jgi:hypothetical protein